MNKLKTAKEAISSIKPGSRVMIGGFGTAGYPNSLIDALCESKIDNLTIISNDLGSPGIGLGRLLRNNQVKALIGTYYNWNPEVAEAKNQGKIEVTLVPQGTFAEAIRAAGVGIPAFYTPTSVGTDLSEGKEIRLINGKQYVLEYAIKADVALIKAYIADELGNLIYYKTARNFNPIMAMAADLVIVEVDEVVPAGSLNPEHIITPHIFVDIITKREAFQ
ncbi:CoA transferase subunit A [Thermovenabulum gondwanense]|uniref:Succinyl-CoA:3-ketoacid coenzyme A transferase subunit A n=1 Tax=Thermovenabulum gondwanense TaxID=520767 RepID=A0A161R9X1_9FIRM|nr:CoA transferase subunit A [Thermovenabulum gondwanense]KYO68619.1 Succinyl-CoA:3-ketoacid coenzyme A transferase subunit A [Thermovenabulum gondwanense]